MRTKSPTRTTPPPAALRVLNLPELLEQILYSMIATSPPDASKACKTASALRLVSPQWASVIDSSPILSTLAFRNHRLLSSTKGDLCIPFLETLKFELSEIEQLRAYKRDTPGLKEIQRFISAQTKHSLILPKIRQAVGLPRYRPSSTKYLLPDLLVVQPPPPEGFNTYLHISGWGNVKWKEELRKYCGPEDFYCLESAIEFKHWYRVKGTSGRGVTVADVVRALMQVIPAYYSFGGGFFEILHIEVMVGKHTPNATWSMPVDYIYRWYLWNPARHGARLNSIVDFTFSAAEWVVLAVDDMYWVTEIPSRLTARSRRRIRQWRRPS